MKTKVIGILLAFLAAIFYSLSTPISKLLMEEVSPVFMASFLYFGAFVGVGIMYLFKFKKEDKSLKLTKDDIFYVVGMVLLDVIAPILMMFGINIGTSSEASLLNNFEIVATSLIALIFFKEGISKKLWVGISLIFASSVILSFNFEEKISFSLGSLLVLLATLCWGIENNFTRKISSKSTYQIVIIKGLGSSICSCVIALIMKESFPSLLYIGIALLLGFVAYGLSIFTYIRAQKIIGASKTSAYYSISPFIGALLSFLILNEKLGINYLIGLVLMIGGTILVVIDTLSQKEDLSLK